MCAVKYDSATKRDEVLINAMPRVNLENIIIYSFIYMKI